MSDDLQGLSRKLTKQGEETLGKLAQDLIDNPLVSGALSRAFEAREKAAQAQVVAMGALNIPSAADIERLTRRLRSVAQRLEGIEDSLDRLDRRLESASGAANDNGDLREAIAELSEQVRALAERPEPKPKPKAKAKPKPKPAA
jgi:predicted  nucleic acid-binding Zn-ribbon protein